MAEYYVCWHGTAPCEECARRAGIKLNKEFSEETLRRLAQGIQDAKDGDIVKREWRKPSLWKRIKERLCS